jgi:hypothetical protein
MLVHRTLATFEQECFEYMSLADTPTMNVAYKYTSMHIVQQKSTWQ